LIGLAVLLDGWVITIAESWRRSRMQRKKTAATAAFLEIYEKQARVEIGAYVVASFGDDPAMADELLALVLKGQKRATTSLVREYAAAGSDPFPSVGEYIVWLDGAGFPRCITRTTEVEVKPLSQVDEQFAWDEGEGERTRAWWLSAHKRYFARRAERDRFVMHDDMEAVFERFEVVWPRKKGLMV
jgi:uncharacterized protein YhfF